MHMLKTKQQWTFAEFHALPDDGNKYEFVDGEVLVTPRPTEDHETIAARLARILDRYVEAQGLGLVYRPRAVLRIEKRVEVEPDLMVRQAAAPNTDWENAPRPILIAEIASEHTRRHDRVKKRGVYMDAEIPDYWIVDAESRTICMIAPGRKDRVATEMLTWHPAGATEPLTFSLDDVFG